MSSGTIHLRLGHILIPLGITPLRLQVLDPLFLRLSRMDVRDLFCIVLMIMFLLLRHLALFLLILPFL